MTQETSADSTAAAQNAAQPQPDLPVLHVHGPRSQAALYRQ